MKIQDIMGEPCRYWVQSESNPETRHLVDLFENQCGCADYVCRRRKYEQETGSPYRCRHILACREHFLEDVLDAMKTHHLQK